MEPRAVLAVDDINLSDIEFWARPWDEREGAFQTLRRQRPIPHFDEPEIPEALTYRGAQGERLLRLDQARRRGRGEPPSRDLPVGQGRNLHDRPARGDERVLRLHDQHGQPAPCPVAADRVGRLQPAHDQVHRGAHRLRGQHRDRPGGRPGRLRFHGRGRRPAAPRDHLQHDGYRARPTTTPCSTPPT